jgi:hypothetical protein
VSHHDPYEPQFRSERFVFVDTVVSGRAVSEIADAFEHEGLNQAHFLLVLDQNGHAMHPAYANKLRALEAAGRATLIPMETLFTEDQGPAVSGVWSVIAPAMMDVARAEVSAFADGIIGSGLYYHEVRARADESNVNVTIGYSQLSTLLMSAVQLTADPDEIAADLDFLRLNFKDMKAIDEALSRPPYREEMLVYAIDLYLDHIMKHRLFDQARTVDVARPRLLKAATSALAVEGSSSHCLRLEIPSDNAATLVRAFKRSLREPYYRDARDEPD